MIFSVPIPTKNMSQTRAKAQRHLAGNTTKTTSRHRNEPEALAAATAADNVVQRALDSVVKKHPKKVTRVRNFCYYLLGFNLAYVDQLHKQAKAARSVPAPKPVVQILNRTELPGAKRGADILLVRSLNSKKRKLEAQDLQDAENVEQADDGIECPVGFEAEYGALVSAFDTVHLTSKGKNEAEEAKKESESVRQEIERAKTRSKKEAQMRALQHLAPVHQVLHTTELLEGILFFLGNKKILRMQRVCKLFKRCYDNSRRLQLRTGQQMFHETKICPSPNNNMSLSLNGLLGPNRIFASAWPFAATGLLMYTFLEPQLLKEVHGPM